MLAVAPSASRAAGAGPTLLLLGGNEWRRGAEAADAWWLGRASRPQVTVLTSPAQDRPQAAAEWARGYFRELGAEVEGCHIQTRAQAANQGLLAQLTRADAVYICGGDPQAGCSVLRGTPAATVLAGLFRAGVPLAGSSAGAMLLGTRCVLPGRGFQLVGGVGLLGDLVVLPHWNSAAPRWRAAARRLASQARLLGLDELTGACWDGVSWQVRGPGRAVLITEQGEVPLGREHPGPFVE
ncbi:MAG: Type 1 glutamine amidotransferase-like domain-containing protein [Candidatus Dormibacteria bacterium]